MDNTVENSRPLFTRGDTVENSRPIFTRGDDVAIIKIILAITSHYYIIIFEISIFIKEGYNYSFVLYTKKQRW